MPFPYTSVSLVSFHTHSIDLGNIRLLLRYYSGERLVSSSRATLQFSQATLSEHLPLADAARCRAIHAVEIKSSAYAAFPQHVIYDLLSHVPYLRTIKATMAQSADYDKLWSVLQSSSSPKAKSLRYIFLDLGCASHE